MAIQPNFVQAENNLGNAFRQKGMASEAIACYQRSIEFQPQFITAQVNLAWMLATWPEASVRNGEKAVALAEHARMLSGDNDPAIFWTLAAACAEAGRFEEAIAVEQKAIALARQSGDRGLVEENEKLLALYLQHQPYHESRSHWRK